MNDLALLSAQGSGELSRLPRTTKKALAQVEGHAMIAHSKLDTLDMLVDRTLDDIARLSAKEAYIAQVLPHAAGRAQMVVNTYTFCANSIISRAVR